MTPDLPINPRAELEARLTALLLGELPADEAVALRERIAQEPELAKLYARLEHTIELVRETAATPADQSADQPAPLKLADERREKLLARFKTVTPKEFAKERKRYVSWALQAVAAIAVLLLIASISIPNFVRSRTTSQSNAIINTLRQIDSAKQEWALEHNKSAADRPTFDDLAPYLRGQPSSIAGESYKLGSVGEPVSAEWEREQSKSLFTRFASIPAREKSVGKQITLSGDGAVTTTTDQMHERATPEVALLSTKPNAGTPWQTATVQLPQAGTITVANSAGKPAAKRESEIHDYEKIRGDTLAQDMRGKPVANIIVLPSSTELAALTPTPTIAPARQGTGWGGPDPRGGAKSSSSDNRATDADAAAAVAESVRRVRSPSPEPSGRSSLGTVALPHAAELADNSKQSSGNVPSEQSRGVDANLRGFYEDSGKSTSTGTAVASEKPVAGGANFAWYDGASGRAGDFGGIADRNAFGLKPSQAPAASGEPPKPSLLAFDDFTKKETSDKHATVSQSTTRGAEPDLMRRRYGIAHGANVGGRGDASAAASKSEITHLPSAASAPVPATIALPTEVAAGDAFFTTGTTRDDVAALGFNLETGHPAPTPQFAENEKLAESGGNAMSWGSYDGSTKARQIEPVERKAAGAPVTAAPPPNIDPATGLPEPLAAPVAQPEVPIKAKFAEVAQADPKQNATHLDLYDSLERKHGISLDTAASGPGFDAEIKAGVASAATSVAGGLGGQAGGGGNRSSGVRFPARPKSAADVPPGLVEPGATSFGDTTIPKDKAQFLGDVPLMGRQFHSEPQTSGSHDTGSPSTATSAPEKAAKSLGFDYYLGNALMNNDSIGLQGGTAPSLTGGRVTDSDSDVKLQLADGLNQNLALNKSSAGTLTLNGANDFSGGKAIVMNYVNNGAIATSDGKSDKLSSFGGRVDTSENWSLEPGNGGLPALAVTNAAIANGGDKPNVYSLSIVGYANVATDSDFHAYSQPFDVNPAAQKQTAQESKPSLPRFPSGGMGISTNRTHTAPGDIGDITFSTDQDSHKAVIVADAETMKQVSQVIAEKKEQPTPEAKPAVQVASANQPEPALKYISQTNWEKAAKGLGPQEREELRKRLDVPTRQVVVESQLLETTNGVAGPRMNWGTVANYSTTDATILQGGKSDRAKEYTDAKRNLEELQTFRKVLNMKIASENLDVTLPKSAAVEIVDNAKPQKSSSIWDWLTGESYASTARVKIEGDQNDIQGMRNEGSASGYDPYFVQTEFEAIQSERVLGKVVDDLKLDQAWAKKGTPGGKLKREDAISQLKKKLDLHPVKNTSLIEIKAKGEKPEEAAKIANTVVKEYKDLRQKQWNERTRAGVQALEARFQEQEQKVREAQAKVEKLGKELEIVDATAAPAATLSTNAPTKEPEPPEQSRPKAPAAEPQPEVQTCDNAFSTFSLNISDVSFKLALASLEKGQMPDAASVRSEEFINAFDYRDPDPPPGAPIGYAFERARYPFAQNRDLVRFSLKTAALGRQAGRPLNLVLLLDNSGSMERADRVRIIHEALRVLASQLQPKDKLSVITFARTARLVADGVAGNEANKFVEEVSGLTPDGGTNLEEAMNTAYATALRHYLPDGINRVVLLTDGAANLGNVEPEALKQRVEAHRKQGVALDCFGIGWEGYNDDLLEMLSRNGDGRYGFINSPEEAATEFAGQLAGALHVAASDVKVQVEFNPKRVVAYRQIGYAKHQLTKQQFRDNTVDAAEIAAQEAGNALYVVEVNPRGEGPIGTVRVRYKVPGTSEYHEHEWEAPYAGSAVDLAQASPAMRLASTASAFSEWLVSSPFAGEVTPDSLLGYLSGVPEVYGADGRPKKLEWAIRQAKSIIGK